MAERIKMHPPRRERIVMAKLVSITIQPYPFSRSAQATAHIWKIQVFPQIRRHLMYHLVQLPHRYIILLPVYRRPIFCGWWAKGTGQRFLPQLDDELSYCITRDYSIRISILKHLNPILPSSMIRSRPPRPRARHLRLSRASPPLRTTTAIFPLLCRCFLPLFRASCCEPLHDAAEAPPNTTLLAPRLLQSHMLYKHTHTPRTVLPQSKWKPLPIQTFLVEQLLLLHAQS